MALTIEVRLYIQCQRYGTGPVVRLLLGHMWVDVVGFWMIVVVQAGRLVCFRRRPGFRRWNRIHLVTAIQKELAVCLLLVLACGM